MGDEEFGSADAIVDKGGASYRFRWDDPGLGWSDGNEVSVNLVQSDQNTPALGTPTISGTAQVDETLTADTTGVEDADGLTNVSYSYQWIAGGTDIDGATGFSYELTSSEQGQTIQVRGDLHRRPGQRRDPCQRGDCGRCCSAQPRGHRPAGHQRHAAGGGDPHRIKLVRSRRGRAEQRVLPLPVDRRGTDIDGATGSSYELTSSEQGQPIQVRVTFTDDAGNAESLTSAATALVEARPNTPATGLPTISGTPQVDETLTADTSGISDNDGLTNVSYSYQWIAGGLDIAGATGSSYTLTSNEQGNTVRVRVTFTDDAGNAESLTSAETVTVTAAPEPLTVRLKVAAPTSHDGSSRVHLRNRVQRGVRPELQDPEEPCLHVTGGSVERAQRTDKPSNIPGSSR